MRLAKRQLPKTILFDCSTVRELARVIFAPEPTSPTSAPPVAHAAPDSSRLGLGAVASKWPGAARLHAVLGACGDAIGELPIQRWAAALVLLEARHLHTRHGGFVAAAERFDSDRFQVAPAEAAAMDPQQRLLLELGYAALERQGQRRRALLGTSTGVWVGIMNADYDADGLHGDSVYACTGGALSVASGRLSYVLGLRGACVSVDTASYILHPISYILHPTS